METNNGRKGGWLKGKPHYDKNGNSLGGIKAVVTDAGNKPVELEGGEVIINKHASAKYWKELSKINQSAGGGVPITKPNSIDEDPEEYKEGGKVGKIEFNPNHIPSKWIISYAEKIKKNNPEIWSLGGNIFGNQAFENLLAVSKRGYWLDNEEWMYIKWRSYVARHHKDFRIEGVVAMLKWVDKVDKGWDYMKDIIETEIKKRKLKKMKTGGNTGQPNDLRKLNYYEGAYRGAEFYSMQDHDDIKAKQSNRWYDLMLKNQKGKKLSPKEFLEFKELSMSLYQEDMNTGGEVGKGIKSEQEHISTAKKLYKHEILPKQAAESIAKEHLKEDSKYYTKLAKIENMAKGGTLDINSERIEVGDEVLLKGRSGVKNIKITNITSKLVYFLDINDSNKLKDIKIDNFIKNYQGKVSAQKPISQPISYTATKSMANYDIGTYFRASTWNEESYAIITNIENNTITYSDEWYTKYPTYVDNFETKLKTGYYYILPEPAFKISQEVLIETENNKPATVSRLEWTQQGWGYELTIDGDKKTGLWRSFALKPVNTVKKEEPIIELEKQPMIAPKKEEVILEEKEESIAKNSEKSLMQWVNENMTNVVSLDFELLTKKTLSEFAITMKMLDENEANKVLQVVNNL